MRKEERRQGRKEDQRAPFQTGLRHHQKNPEAEGGLHAREVRPSWVQGRQVQPYSALQSPLSPLVQAVPAVLQKAARLRQVTIWWEHIKFQFPRTVEQLWVATVLCGNCVATVWQLCGNCVATMCQLCGNSVATVWQLTVLHSVCCVYPQLEAWCRKGCADAAMQQEQRRQGPNERATKTEQACAGA